MLVAFQVALLAMKDHPPRKVSNITVVARYIFLPSDCFISCGFVYLLLHFLFFWRKYRREQKLRLTMWRVKWKDVSFGDGWRPNTAPEDVSRLQT